VWLAISVPWSPVNKFTVLTIEDPNTIDSELVDALPPYPPHLGSTLQTQVGEKTAQAPFDQRFG